DGSCSMEIQACHPASTEPATFAMNTSMETLMHSDAVWKESSGRVPARRSLISRWFASVAFSIGVLLPAAALAQAAPEGKGETTAPPAGPAGKGETPNAPSG